MKSNRKYLNTDELIDFLENEKKLIYPDEKSKEKFKLYLTQYNYNFFVKGLKNNLMFDENGKYKKEFDSNQIRYLFDIDRRISVILFKYFKSLEFLLNNSFTSIISKHIFKETNTPYISALTKDQMSETFSNRNTVYKYYGLDSLSNIVSEFYKNFYESGFFNEKTFKNKDSENESIIKKIEKAWFLQDINYKKSCSKQKNNWIYAEIFSITYLLTFGQIIKLAKSLNNDLKNQVIRFFSKSFNKQSKNIKIDEPIFNLVIDIFSNLRNILAHNSNLIKFRYEIDTSKISFNFFKLLGYKKDNLDEKIVINLYDTIILLEKIIETPKNKIINDIKEDLKNKSNISIETGNSLSDLLMEIIENETGIKFR